MSGITNSLRERLDARPEPKVHPDADLLTAYREQALSTGERERLQQHLAECRRCRAVLALSQPADEETLVEPVVSRSRAWALAFRWTAVAATMALAVALMVEKPWEHRNPKLSSKDLGLTATAPAPVQVKSLTGPAEEPAKTAALASDDAVAKQPASNILNGAISMNEGRLRTSSISAGAAGERDKDAKRLEPPARVDQPVAEAAAAVNPAVGGPIGRINTLPAALDAAPAPLPLFPQMQTTGFLAETLPGLAPASTLDYGKLKQGGELAKSSSSQSSRFVYVFHPLATSARKVFSGIGTTTSTTTVGMGMFGGLPRATVSRSRTADVAAATEHDKTAIAATTLQDFPLAARSFTAEMKAKATGENLQASWRIQDGKVMKSDAGQWQEAQTILGAKSPFLVVASTGDDVWAGGANALVVHSHDGGVTWEKIKLGDSATGDVVKIAADGTAITVITSAERQTWVSHDGGKSWNLQNPQN